MAGHCRRRFPVRHSTQAGSDRERGASSGPHRYEVTGRAGLHRAHSTPAGNVEDEGTLFALGVANITYGSLHRPDVQLD